MITNSAVVEELRFQNQVYSLLVIKKAAYRLSDRCTFEFEVSGADTICRLRFPCETSSASIAATLDDFQREVLDQDLRQTIADETVNIRNVILAHAFSRTGLQAK